MKKEIRQKIYDIIDRQNLVKLKDTLAFLSNCEKLLNNHYAFYDSWMMLCNVDLWYIIEITDSGNLVYVDNDICPIEKNWFATKSILKEYYEKYFK